MADKILLTGGTGFVGSHLIARLLAETDWEIVSLERLPRSLDVKTSSNRVHRLYQDLLSPVQGHLLRELEGVRYIVHAGAEVSGVKSVLDSTSAVRTNVMGTYHLLRAACKLHSSLERFIFISTGEVVGYAPERISWDEEAPLRPSNPYAAAKAAAETLCSSWHLSFGVPTVIVRSMNLFGAGQTFDRFIPRTLQAIIDGKTVTCHVDAGHRPGSRNWLHVGKFTRALLDLVQIGKIGETYHVVGPERNNAFIIETLGLILGVVPRVETAVAGPSHDHRYALCDTKLGLNFEDDFFDTLVDTAHWYQESLRCPVS